MERLAQESLFKKYQSGECSAEERAIVEDYIINNEHYPVPVTDQELYAATDILSGRIRKIPHSDKNRKLTSRIYIWKRYTAVAAAIALILSGIYFFKAGRWPFVNRQSEIVGLNDIAPGKNRAIITLANGKTITLSDDKTGVAVDGGKLVYNDHSLVQYASGTQFSGPQKGGQKITGPVSALSLGVKELLTVSTPKGGTYQVVLPDGTRVWLNAASSLRFPSGFAGLKERKVELLSGEAYFEVAKVRVSAEGLRSKEQGLRSKDQRGARMPFIVLSKGQEVKVLGTHFNINSYADEESVKTTLLEGSVQVSASGLPGGGIILEPGQQAILKADQINMKTVNLEQELAWKNGYIRFDELNIHEIMRVLGRWYDVEVIYQGPIPNTEFTGSITRYKSLGEVLKMLQSTDKIHFKIEGRRVVVSR